MAKVVTEKWPRSVQAMQKLYWYAYQEGKKDDAGFFRFQLDPLTLLVLGENGSSLVTLAPIYKDGNTEFTPWSKRFGNVLLAGRQVTPQQLTEFQNREDRRLERRILRLHLKCLIPQVRK
jgi:hypothetical protein